VYTDTVGSDTFIEGKTAGSLCNFQIIIRQPGLPLKRPLDDENAETETGHLGLNSWWNMVMMTFNISFISASPFLAFELSSLTFGSNLHNKRLCLQITSVLPALAFMLELHPLIRQYINPPYTFIQPTFVSLRRSPNTHRVSYIFLNLSPCNFTPSTSYWLLSSPHLNFHLPIPLDAVWPPNPFTTPWGRARRFALPLELDCNPSILITPPPSTNFNPKEPTVASSYTTFLCPHSTTDTLPPHFNNSYAFYHLFSAKCNRLHALQKFANHKTHALPTDELKIYVIAHTMKDGNE
jgi:hypothetical protein